MADSRVHHKIVVAVFGNTNGKVDKSVIHTVELYTGVNRDGFIESVHDRHKRFLDECTGGVPADAPATQIKSVELADPKDRPPVSNDNVASEVREAA